MEIGMSILDWGLVVLVYPNYKLMVDRIVEILPNFDFLEAELIDLVGNDASWGGNFCIGSFGTFDQDQAG
jgi:hypothetical protein